MLGSLILYLKGMRIMMFQLSGFYCSSDTEPKGRIEVIVHASIVPQIHEPPGDS